MVAALETEFLYRNREITWIFDAKKLDLSAGGRSVNLVVQEVIQSLYNEPVLLLFTSNLGGGTFAPLAILFPTALHLFYIIRMPDRGRKV